MKAVFYLCFIANFILFTTGCKKIDSAQNENNHDLDQPAFFKNASKADKKFAADIQILKKYSKQPGNVINGIANTDNPLWEFMSHLGQSNFKIIPVQSNENTAGFLLLQNVSGKQKVEYYKFGVNFKQNEKALNSKDAFILNIMLNKIINNKNKYVFKTILDVPLLFKKFSKLDSIKQRIGENDPITIHVETSTQFISGLTFPVCATRVCEWVETPNFNFVEVCWYQNGCAGDPWGGNSDVTYENPYGGNNGGGNCSCSVESMLNTVGPELNLSSEMQNYLLLNDPQTIIQLYFYLQNSTQQNKIEIARTHVEAFEYLNLIPNTEYRELVYRHRETGSSNFLWFEDATWLDNPENFNIDIDYDGQQYRKLTAAEKALVAVFPVQAAIISSNATPAINRTIAEYPNPNPAMYPNFTYNDKADAFRHAYFNAVNTRDCPASVIPFHLASWIVKEFAIAHESEVPPQLVLEKQMDLYNNDIGISYCWNCYITTNTSIANAMKEKVTNGEMKYLKPLNQFDPYWHRGPDGRESTATNGITVATQLAYTNQ
jgi:hypothetical protein